MSELRDDARRLDRAAAKQLPAGGPHYTAFVGPPAEYDVMGATQFRLLTTLGLRENHRLLDFGCGSLRAGRLLIPYLLPGCYYGLDPTQWLIEDAIANEIGRELVKLRQPTFWFNDDFAVAFRGVSFDFILAQSIFSHAGRDLVFKALDEFRLCLNGGGLILATFIEPERLGLPDENAGSGWTYPGCVTYRHATVLALARSAGLVGRPIPWFHPRQTWFVMARSEADLPAADDDVHLSGIVLRDASLRP